jgi:hypothetical protein
VDGTAAQSLRRAVKMERTGSAATGVGQEDDVVVKAGSVPRWSECAAAT